MDVLIHSYSVSVYIIAVHFLISVESQRSAVMELSVCFMKYQLVVFIFRKIFYFQFEHESNVNNSRITHAYVWHNINCGING